MGDCCAIHPGNECYVPCCCGPPKCPCPCGILVERTKPIRPDVVPAFSCAPFNGLTTYRSAYLPKCAPRTLSFRPSNAFDPSCTPLEGLTTYRTAFYPKCGTRTLSLKPTADFDPSCAPLDGITTYRKDYAGCQTSRVKSMKPSANFDPSCAPMDGITTYRLNYVPYCPNEYGWAKQGSTKVPVVGGLSCAAFQGLTTYRTDFHPKCGPKAISLKPTTRPAFSDAPFADCTTYRCNFPPFCFKSEGRGSGGSAPEETFPCYADVAAPSSNDCGGGDC